MPQENNYWLTTVFLELSIKERLRKLKPLARKTILYLKVKYRKVFMRPKVEPSKECLLMHRQWLIPNRPRIFPKSRKSNSVKIFMAVLVLPVTKLPDKVFLVRSLR